MLCAGLYYFIARDRVSSKAALAPLLGFLLGPIGVAVTFFVQEDDAEVEDVSTSQANTSVVVGEAKSLPSGEGRLKAMQDLKRDLESFRSKLDSKKTS